MKESKGIKPDIEKEEERVGRKKKVGKKEGRKGEREGRRDREKEIWERGDGGRLYYE